MNNKALTLSILMGILALFFVNSYVTSVEDEARKKFGTEVLVVVANKDIREMDTIMEPMITFAHIPKKFLEPAAISIEAKDESANGVKSLKSFVGMVAVVPIKKGEQLTYNKITDPSLRTGLSPQITPGRRAIAVPVNEISGVSKLVKPGDRVDVIAVLDFGGGKESRIAKTILQDVVILSIGRYVTNNLARLIEPDPFAGKERVKSLVEDFGFSSVSLEVDPVQAQVLSLALSTSEISLSLRNNDDSDQLKFAASSIADLVGSDMGLVKFKSTSPMVASGGIKK